MMLTDMTQVSGVSDVIVHDISIKIQLSIVLYRVCVHEITVMMY